MGMKETSVVILYIAYLVHQKRRIRKDATTSNA